MSEQLPDIQEAARRYPTAMREIRRSQIAIERDSGADLQLLSANVFGSQLIATAVDMR